MSKLLKIVMSVILLFTTGCKKEEVQEETIITPVQQTFAMWISFLEYQENNQPIESFVNETVSNCKDLGINTLYVHTTAFTDAFYDSNIYGQNETIKGTDPFGLFVKEAHKQGLQVYAWVNPLRSVEVEQINTLDETKSGSKQIMDWAKHNDERLRQVNGRYYLNPAYDEVVNLVQSVISEQMKEYDLDGVIMDDYFYPDQTDKRFDAYIYSKALLEDEELSIKDFRLNATNHLIDVLHQTCKQQDIPFGISCSGNIANNLDLLFADPYTWCNKGYVDFIAPQIYWGYNHPIKPFAQTYEEWSSIAKGIPLIPALAAYKCGVEDVYAKDGNLEWIEDSNMLAKETQTCLDQGSLGVSYFRYHSLFKADDSLQGHMNEEVEALKNTIIKR